MEFFSRFAEAGRPWRLAFLGDSPQQSARHFTRISQRISPAISADKGTGLLSTAHCQSSLLPQRSESSSGRLRKDLIRNRSHRPQHRLTSQILTRSQPPPSPAPKSLPQSGSVQPSAAANGACFLRAERHLDLGVFRSSHGWARAAPCSAAELGVVRPLRALASIG